MTLSQTLPPNDVTQVVQVILGESNYNSWRQPMTSYLKIHKLWRYVAGERPKPIKRPDETASSFLDRMEDWDSINQTIITCFINTSVTSICMLFRKFDSAKEAWDLLAERFKLPIYHYQHLSKLHRIRQQPGQSVEDLFMEMSFVWNELAFFEPEFGDADSTKKFIAYRDQECLMQFLIALHDDFDYIRTSILHRDPLPSLDRVVSELRCMEKHLPTMKLQKS